MRLNQTVRIVCRDSPLSLVQAKEIVGLFPPFEYTQEAFASYGDKNKNLSLMGDVASDFFTRELDEALLKGEADISIHSAKDLPYPLPAGLELFCLTEGKDKSDSLVSVNNLTLENLPTGARVGTSSPIRKAELLRLRNDLQIVSIRGTIAERIALVDAGEIDALIVATCALERLQLSHRIAERLPFKTHPLQGNLAIVGRKGEEYLKQFFAQKDIRQTYGRVTLVGFGPGNPDLLTIAGDKALAQADVILHDDLLDKEFLCKYKAEKVYVGKRRGCHSFNQDQINETIYAYATQGKRVVRLKGGDPMVFAHGREEVDYLQSRFIEVDVLPGITTALALAASTHIPLTHRGIASSVALATGHTVQNVGTVQADTLVVYMGGTQVQSISNTLIERGKPADTPVALVHNVSRPDQQIFYSTLGELRYTVYNYPTPIIIVVGEVVNFEKKGVAKPRTLVTGTTSKEHIGTGDVVHTPLINVQKNDADGAMRTVLTEQLSTFQWIVFTSRYGVRFFFELLDEFELDIRVLGNAKIASVGGTTTQELAKHHLYPDIESHTESAEGLLLYFNTFGKKNERFLLPRSNKGLPALRDGLLAMGNDVVDLPVYVNTPNNEAQRVDLTEIQKIVFSSPSCVDAFLDLYGGLPTDIPLVARGKTTLNHIQKNISDEKI